MDNIRWELSGAEVEAESFRLIDELVGEHDFNPADWQIARRLIHTVGDPTIVADLQMANQPMAAGIAALKRGAPIFCDSNMALSGVSLARLKKVNPDYDRDRLHCYIADEDVAGRAAETGLTRASLAVEKARPLLDGAIVLIGNAPLALANIVRLARDEQLCPALVIGIPVGFVNVVEAKEMLSHSDLPQITIKGRRGGSALAVAALHGLIEGYLLG